MLGFCCGCIFGGILAIGIMSICIVGKTGDREE